MNALVNTSAAQKLDFQIAEDLEKAAQEKIAKKEAAQEEAAKKQSKKKTPNSKKNFSNPKK